LLKFRSLIQVQRTIVEFADHKIPHKRGDARHAALSGIDLGILMPAFISVTHRNTKL